MSDPTNEQRARELLDYIGYVSATNAFSIKKIKEALDAAEARENEACIKIVEETVADYCNVTDPEDVTAMAPIVLMDRIVNGIRQRQRKEE
jgi:hypothetical protein